MQLHQPHLQTSSAASSTDEGLLSVTRNLNILDPNVSVLPAVLTLLKFSFEKKKWQMLLLIRHILVEVVSMMNFQNAWNNEIKLTERKSSVVFTQVGCGGVSRVKRGFFSERLQNVKQQMNLAHIRLSLLQSTINTFFLCFVPHRKACFSGAELWRWAQPCSFGARTAPFAGLQLRGQWHTLHHYLAQGWPVAATRGEQLFSVFGQRISPPATHLLRQWPFPESGG